MLKSELIKFFFERKEVRFLYIGATGFRSHTSPAIFVLVLCLLCLYYACTMPTKSTMPVLCLFITSPTLVCVELQKDVTIYS